MGRVDGVCVLAEPHSSRTSTGRAPPIAGPPPAISPLELTKRGSLFLTRPTLFNYIATRQELDAAARELFAVVRAKKVRIVIGQQYPLSRAADAHRDLEGRRTTGSTVLVPEGSR